MPKGKSTARRSQRPLQRRNPPSLDSPFKPAFRTFGSVTGVVRQIWVDQKVLVN
jgi:hypothetical protein